MKIKIKKKKSKEDYKQEKTCFYQKAHLEKTECFHQTLPKKEIFGEGFLLKVYRINAKKSTVNILLLFSLSIVLSLTLFAPWIFSRGGVKLPPPLHPTSLFLMGKCQTLEHLVSRVGCNTRVIVDASSNPPVSNVKSL